VGKDIDASGDAELPPDETSPFEAEDHLVARRQCDAKMALHVGFGRSLSQSGRPAAGRG
jgi:hypothetical protein